MSGGPAVLSALAATGVWSAARAVRRGHTPELGALLALTGLLGYLTLLRPWSRSWGATIGETLEEMPGDELVPDPAIAMTRAVTIDAPADVVWAWLAQIGQDRAGFYSYSWLENLAGCQLHNADRIHPEWQQRSVGEIVPLHPATGVAVQRFEPPHVLAFEGWYFVVEPLDEHRTRLYARTRVRRGPGSFAYAALVELPHFVMERKMLLGIKHRAEHS
jgi:hypothetical protein